MRFSNRKATDDVVAPGHQSGFSLIELMVGILVSIIGTLAIMAAFANFEGHKRSTTSGDDAQQSGSYALYKLERVVRSAGSGFTQGKNHGIWGCTISSLVSGTLPPPFSTAGLPAAAQAMPVLIASGGTGPDVISVMSGNSALQVFKVGVTSAPTATALVVGNSFGLLANDYLIGTLADGTCELGQVGPTFTSGNTLPLNNNVPLNAANTQVTGLANAINVFDLGPEPIMSLLGVDTTSNTLVEFDQLQRAVNGGAANLPIANGIVMMKALYGVPGPTGLTWVQPTTTWSIGALTASMSSAFTAASQIKAIRIAVVAESRLPERNQDYHPATNTLTLFPDLPPAVQFSMPTNPQFRYKVYDTTIPVRNALINRYY